MKRTALVLFMLAPCTFCYSQYSSELEKADSLFCQGKYNQAYANLYFYEISTGNKPDQALVNKYLKCNELLDGGQKAKSLDEKWINYLQLEELNPDDPTIKAEKEKAEKGNGDDLNSIGRYYENVKKDSKQALLWYKKSIKRYCDSASLFYKQDSLQKAFDYYLKAANMGEPIAQINVAWRYEKGEGVDEDLSKAKYWYEKAAEQGDNYAKDQLEILNKPSHVKESMSNNSKVNSDTVQRVIADTPLPPPPKKLFDSSRCDNDVQGTIGYKYSKDFPFAVTSICNFEDIYDHFANGGFEVGVNLDNKVFERNALNMKSGETVRTTKIYNPLLYTMLISGWNFRVVSLNLGYGCVFYKKQLIAKKYSRIERPITTTTQIITQVSVNGDSQTSFVSSQDTEVVLEDVVSLNKKIMLGASLILQPSISFNLPIDDDCYYASINIGYNFVPRIKELNGISCGVSFSWEW